MDDASALLHVIVARNGYVFAGMLRAIGKQAEMQARSCYTHSPS